uniref:Uncharacterized protein n=1 Tax=Mycena chlorophos TaxID=658473 RepID=A0ABQ0LWI6_MYCCL|nr:predicted protein [Mycena chlorophos]
MPHHQSASMPRKSVKFSKDVEVVVQGSYPAEKSVPGPANILKDKSSTLWGKLDLALAEDPFLESLNALAALTELSNDAFITMPEGISCINMTLVDATAPAGTPALGKAELRNVITVKDFLLALRRFVRDHPQPSSSNRQATLVDSLRKRDLTWFRGVSGKLLICGSRATPRPCTYFPPLIRRLPTVSLTPLLPITQTYITHTAHAYDSDA